MARATLFLYMRERRERGEEMMNFSCRFTDDFINFRQTDKDVMHILMHSEENIFLNDCDKAVQSLLDAFIVWKLNLL